MKLRRILGALGVITLAAVGTQLIAVQASSAHTPSASVTCTTWSIGAQNYQATQHNTYSYSIDGAAAVTGSFGTSFTRSGTFDTGTGNHTLVGYVYQNDAKNAQYSKTYNLSTAGCATAKVTLCDATDSNTNPYRLITADLAGAYGHLGHTGPVWNPTLKSHHIKWGDIIPTFTYGGHQYSSNVPAGQSILDNGCDVAPESVSAGAPAFADGSCSTDPAYVIPQEPAGVLDVVTGGGTGALWGKTVKVTFSADEGYTLTGQAVYSHTFGAQPDCRTAVTPVDPHTTQASCDHVTGIDSGFAITPATTDGIDYTVDGLVVTATAQTGHMLGAVPSGWTSVSDTVATYTVTEADPSCLIDVTPVDPRWTQASCDHVTGIDSGFAITPATTDGIDYTLKGLVVTANAQTGHALGAMPSGWTSVSDTVATYTVTEADPICLIDVLPVAPAVTDPGCSATGNTPVLPTLTVAETAHVSYQVPAGPYAGGTSVVVAATALDGYEFTAATMPTWWTLDGSDPAGTAATYVVYFADTPACVTAIAPTFTDDGCVGGGSGGASITLSPSDAADYFIDGVLVADGSYPAADGALVTVIVEPLVGYQLTGTTSWTHQFSTAPSCEVGGAKVVRSPTAHTPAHQPDRPAAVTVAPLASTGVPAVSFLLVGGALLLLGTGLCVVATTRWGSRA